MMEDDQSCWQTKSKCVICWQSLGSKKQLLHGVKCLKFGIREKLKLILHPHDFKALYNEEIFPEPRICNLCFVTIRQTPQGISKLQDLLGDAINLRLYKPNRNNWDAKTEETTVSAGKLSEDAKRRSSSASQSQQDNGKHNTQAVSTGTESGPKSKIQQRVQAENSSKVVTNARADRTESLCSTTDPSECCQQVGQWNDQKRRQRQAKGKVQKEKFEVPTKVVSSEHSDDRQEEEENADPRSGASEMPVTRRGRRWRSQQATDEATVGTVGEDDVGSLDTADPSSGLRIISPTSRQDKGQREMREKTNSKSSGRKIHQQSKSCRSTLTRNVGKNDRSEQEVTSSGPGSTGRFRTRQMTRNQTRKCEDKDVHQTNTVNTNITLAHSRKRTASQRSNSLPAKRLKRSGERCEKADSQRTLRVNSDKISEESKQQHQNSTGSSKIKVGKTWLHTDIPAGLSDSSQTKLKDLIQQASSYLSSRPECITSTIMIKCREKGCQHSYPLWTQLATHLKYYHYDGAVMAGDHFLKTMSILASETAVVEAEFPHKCSYEGCSLVFTSADSCEHHQSTHQGAMTHICSYPDCGRGFRLPTTLQIHFRTHTGVRPFACPVKDCKKCFKHRSDLTMHQRRHTGEKPHKCPVAGCERRFTTSTELTDHTEAQHGQSDTSTCICDICDKQLTTRRALYNHKRKILSAGQPGRYKCPYENCNSWFVRKDKYELHLCTHSAERLLCCEKCGKQFGCQRYLDVHHKVHEKNERNAQHPPERSHVCEVSGCQRKFTSRVYMKRHVISYHMGRRPRPMPGVFHTCPVQGCGRKFSLKSTLCRHNLLVHKGGDYKLHRAVVKYACTYEGCGREFNRRHLLKEHIVREHGTSSQSGRPADGSERECVEEICTECGIVLSPAKMSRHKAAHLSTQTCKEKTQEMPPFRCHWCPDVAFTSVEERRTHIQGHIDNPPYKCEVEDCKQTFFLVKNMDNHLWNHCKKVSTCPVEGCAQTFDNQLLLAKHSQVHYDGKMKCPWRNCGDWFTAMGTLKQHFLAHSRSLTARFGSDFVCQVCDRVFSSKYGLRNHQRTHEEKDSDTSTQTEAVGQQFQCEEPGCQETLGQFREFFDHFLHHYTNTAVTCSFPQCHQVLPTLLQLARHGKCHYDGKYRCPWQGCDKTFASSFFQVKKHMYRHILTLPEVATNRPHTCTQCDMVFRYHSNLIGHQAQHPEKSDYVCPICGKKFSHNHLKRHMLTHGQEKAHQCPHCSVRYGTVNGLKFHILQTHGIGKWPFQCSFCGKGFISSTELRRHMPSHTKEKPFSCQECGLSFATHTGYKGHMRKHSGQKYVCDVEGCGKVYTTPLSMRGHKAQHAGFRQTCQHCGKVYNNPYGHKCKASRQARKSVPRQDPSRPQPVVMCPERANSVFVNSAAPLPPVASLHQPPPLTLQPVGKPQSELPQSTSCTVVAPNSSPHLGQYAPNMLQTVQPGFGQGVNSQTLPAGVAHQSLQATPLDMTRVTAGTSVDVSGDYTFNNYIVFWDNHNMG